MKTRIIGAIVALLLAAIGAVLLVGYVRGADARAAQGAELTDVYVAQDPIPEGTPGESVGNFVKVDSMPKKNVAPGTVTNLDDLAGLVADAEILPGEQVLTERFVDPLELAAKGDVPVPDGMQEVTIALPLDRVVGGRVQAGSMVGFVYTTSTLSLEATQGLAVTEFVYHRMLVTRVTPGTSLVANDSGDKPSDSGNGATVLMVTLAATTPQVEKIVYGAEQYEDGLGGIWLTLEPETADTNGSTQRSGENVFG